MPPAVAIAGIGAAASIGGAVLGAGAQRRAANQASDTAAQNTAANNALTREIYGQNASRLDPFVQSGLRAGGALNGLLGLGGAAPTTGALGGGTSGVDWAAYTRGNPDAMADWQRYHQDMSLADYGQYHYAADGSRRNLAPYTAGAAAGQTGTAASAKTAADKAFKTFLNSSNYKWRFNQGNEALQMSALPGGTFDSGQTRKAIVEYGQNFAANELGSYMDRLAQQQSLGLSGASALAGVGTNMVGQVTANNNAAAGAAANAALINGTATANMYGGIAGALGNAAGNIWGAGGSSYGGGGSSGGWSVYGGT